MCANVRNDETGADRADRFVGENAAVGATLAITRRDAVLAASAAALLGRAIRPGAAEAQAPPMDAIHQDHAVDLHTTVNGQVFYGRVDVRTSLLDLLREHLHLTGTKKGCDHGQCGACTVHLDGRRIASCLTLAAKVEGRSVLTIEGVAQAGELHPMQQAFIDHDALQCGYCTPGQIMSAIACVREGNATSRDRIREYMSGNICRCGAYVGIVEAIEQAAVKMEPA